MTLFRRFWEFRRRVPAPGALFRRQKKGPESCVLARDAFDFQGGACFEGRYRAREFFCVLEMLSTKFLVLGAADSVSRGILHFRTQIGPPLGRSLAK